MFKIRFVLTQLSLWRQNTYTERDFSINIKHFLHPLLYKKEEKKRIE